MDFRILIMFGTLYGVALIVKNLIYPDRVEKPNEIDKLRISYKDQSLVLHMPSYYNGIEAYCEPSEQYDKQLLEPALQHWLKRI